MIKKYISYIGVVVLAFFSFYYTDKAADIVKRNDPIMKEIEFNNNTYSISPVNAIVTDDEIIPGVNGISVDINKSYKNMKRDNIYNSDLLVFKEIIPTVSLINDYNKYIISGNKNKKQVALIFKIDDISYIDTLNDILLNKMVTATFFIDGTIIENNHDKIVEIIDNKYEIENLGYDNEYSIDKFEWTNNLIESYTKEDPKFCYTDYKVENILELCSKYNMYTIKPTISVTNYPFITVKKNINNGSIISFNIYNETIKELPSIISYIKQKGYTLVNLKELISEKNMVE